MYLFIVFCSTFNWCRFAIDTLGLWAYLATVATRSGRVFPKTQYRGSEGGIRCYSRNGVVWVWMVLMVWMGQAASEVLACTATSGDHRLGRLFGWNVPVSTCGGRTSGMFGREGAHVSESASAAWDDERKRKTARKRRLVRPPAGVGEGRGVAAEGRGEKRGGGGGRADKGSLG